MTVHPAVIPGPSHTETKLQERIVELEKKCDALTGEVATMRQTLDQERKDNVVAMERYECDINKRVQEVTLLTATLEDAKQDVAFLTQQLAIARRQQTDSSDSSDEVVEEKKKEKKKKSRKRRVVVLESDDEEEVEELRPEKKNKRDVNIDIPVNQEYTVEALIPDYWVVPKSRLWTLPEHPLECLLWVIVLLSFVCLCLMNIL